MRWKAAIMGPTGAATAGAAFRLLYPFPTRAVAEAHAKCFRAAGVLLELVPGVDGELDETDAPRNARRARAMIGRLNRMLGLWLANREDQGLLREIWQSMGKLGFLA
jgi:hypothetical protein